MGDEKYPNRGEADNDVTRVTSDFGSSGRTDSTQDEATRFSTQPGSTDDPRGRGAASSGTGEKSKIGLLLNHIWKVRRLIAQGGMGEVYEGVETNTGEPVAIKFLLPRLTADREVKELFLSEARSFVRVSKMHSALVQYRVCAEDPTLGETYIVMEFVDGAPLSEIMATLKPNLQQIAGFMRLVAAALDVAHKAGVIHRDLSPRNILIPARELTRAKIIDFGIAKDVGTGQEATIFGGFKGNLVYCAPEQFNEGGSGDAAQVGPWTDIYSLGLVVLALAVGKAPPMGGTFTEAITKRQKVPDLSGAPKELAPLLARMLAPDPTKRLRSMGDIIAALDEVVPLQRKRSTTPILIAAAAIVLAIGAAAFLMPRGPSEDEIRQRAGSSLAAADCSWLGLGPLGVNGGKMQATLSGAARDVVSATAAAQRAAGVAVAFDTKEVSAVGPQACGPLNAFRQFREPPSAAGPSLAVQQRLFRLGNDARYCGQDGLRKARVTVNLRLDDPSTDFTLLGLEPNGQMQQLIADRAQFEAARAANPDLAPNLGGNIYTMSFCVDEATAARSNSQGAVGLVLVKGQGPFSLGFDPNASDSVAVPQNWSEGFAMEAMTRHWVTQIAWYQIVSQ